VQAGEDVDVEAALGTGNEVKEKEWEEGTLSGYARLAASHANRSFSNA